MCLCRCVWAIILVCPATSASTVWATPTHPLTLAHTHARTHARSQRKRRALWRRRSRTRKKDPNPTRTTTHTPNGDAAAAAKKTRHRRGWRRIVRRRCVTVTLCVHGCVCARARACVCAPSLLYGTLCLRNAHPHFVHRCARARTHTHTHTYIHAHSHSHAHAQRRSGATIVACRMTTSRVGSAAPCSGT